MLKPALALLLALPLLAAGAGQAAAIPGRLQVVKEIVNTTGRPTPTGSFRLNIDCSTGPDFTVLATAPGSLTHSFAIPASVRCTVFEPKPSSPPPPCRWVVSYPAGQSGGSGDTVVVRNTLVCGLSPLDRK